MFNEMRRNDRCINKEQMESILMNGQYGILSTTGENGYAYGVPLNFIYLDGSIYFHCAQEGSKLANIQYNNKVSFCVVGSTESIPEKFSYRYESAIVFGKTTEVFDKIKENALTELLHKYAPEFVEKGIAYIQKDMHKTTVIKIEIEHMTGKARV